ncbi:DUF928 domain-containing protein [cf. Phormidesmis sp. LEGE 11477]|uniref:DUF928 domain-containing protein n=1 Tax=cf. Phormidesmis sp. LEGE 11477 TaxID=1828680 RepID=UPI00187E0762|nr:DUF928 domain-containing protein [cf. Phormidesmis sp. LEGE 11477]MBE9060895.1 DUF928 domain-containing protein [cf. Phormidesmis sp. LEGE 11477]
MKAPRMIFSLLIFALLPMAIAKPHPVDALANESLIEKSLIEQAQPSSTESAFMQIGGSAPLRFVPPPPPERGHPTGRSEGGASRGSCHVAGDLPLTAIVPFADGYISPSREGVEASAATSFATGTNTTPNASSLTTKGHPSFWFYVPYSLETTSLEFVLQDENNNTIYQATLSKEMPREISDSSFDSDHGIIQIALPESVPALALETSYRWFFLAYCQQNDPDFVEGWITRRSPLPSSLADELAIASPREQAVLYAQNGIWQETLTVLGEQYRDNETNLEILRDWASLLESANLEHLTQQPLLDCCEIE